MDWHISDLPQSTTVRVLAAFACAGRVPARHATKSVMPHRSQDSEYCINCGTDPPGPRGSPGPVAARLRNHLSSTFVVGRRGRRPSGPGRPPHNLWRTQICEKLLGITLRAWATSLLVKARRPPERLHIVSVFLARLAQLRLQLL